MGTVTPRPNVCQRCRWVILPEGRTLCYFCAPRCMSAEDFARWQELNEAAGADRASSPCEDCTADHAAAMRDVDRCNGTLRESAPLSDRFLTGEALERRRDQWRAAQRRRRARVAA